MRLGQFLVDPALLGPAFGASTWATWRLVLRAALAEPLNCVERQRFKQIADRDPPRRRVRELWLAVGRRGGKDSAISALATYLAVFGEFQPRLRWGERCSVLCLAVDKTQARIVFDFIRAYFERVPLLRSMLVNASDGIIELNNSVEIVIATNSFRSIRGRTIACVVMDELAYWRDESSTNPDREVYRALIPALITLRKAGAMLVAISSVYRKTGLLYEKITSHIGRDGDDVLAILAPSVVFNPTLGEPEAAAEIERERLADPENAAAEYDSIWRSDIAGFIDRAVAEGLVDVGIKERPYDPRQRYNVFVDVASGSGGDAFAVSVAHYDQLTGMAVQDALRYWTPPFSSEDCFAEAARLGGIYHCTKLVGDRWGAGVVMERFNVAGATMDQSARPKGEIYTDFLHLANSGKCRLLDDRRQLGELIGLERRLRWGGGESVDHGRNGHDDVINAGAGALTLAAAGGAKAGWCWTTLDMSGAGSRGFYERAHEKIYER